MPATTPLSALVATWNNVATAFDGIKLNVTKTAADAASMLLRLQKDSADIFTVRHDGQVKMTWRGFPGGLGEGQYGRFEPYTYGIAYKQGGGTGTSSKDNRLELYLGDSDTSPAELSVRHNGNNTGAVIQARNAGDTDGMFLDFQEASYPTIRWGNTGPYLVKESAGILVMRNKGTVGEAQRFRVANTYTPGDVREYVELGFSSSRGKVRTVGVGGGSQLPLDIDGSTLQLQTGSTLRWGISATGLLQGGGTGATAPALKYSGTTLKAVLADDSADAPFTAASLSASTYLKSGSYTVATVPSAATVGAGGLIYVSNEAGGAIPAFSDATDWRRVTDRAIIS